MLMTESLIPAELTIAPNPSTLSLNLKLTTIPIDAYTAFELWLPTKNAILSSEEALLLTSDRPRLEGICAKLTWLLGASLVRHEMQAPDPLAYDWQAVLAKIQRSGFDAIGITYLPQTICPNLTREGISASWTLCPASWNVSFLQFQPVANGYRVKTHALSLLISYGQPITKRVRNSVNDIGASKF